MGIDVPIVELKVVWHVGVPCSGSQVANFFVTGLKCFCEVVDVGVGSGELLGSDGGASLHCGGEAICHCGCDFTEFISAETDEGFG